MELDLLRVLGNAELIASGQRQKLPEKGFQLLSYLTLSQSHRATRRQLADLLWDSSDDTAALSNLRQLLLRLRRFAALESMLESDATAVWLKPSGQDSDLARFMRLVLADTLPETLEALSLYRGDLLDETQDTSSAYAQWLSAARSRLRDLFFALKLADFYGQGVGFAVAEDAELDVASWRSLADNELERAAVLDFRAIEFAQHVATLEAGLACG